MRGSSRRCCWELPLQNGVLFSTWGGGGGRGVIGGQMGKRDGEGGRVGVEEGLLCSQGLAARATVSLK